MATTNLNHFTQFCFRSARNLSVIGGFDNFVKSIHIVVKQANVELSHRRRVT